MLFTFDGKIISIINGRDAFPCVELKVPFHCEVTLK